jgi:hypothetical protein
MDLTRVARFGSNHGQTLEGLMDHIRRSQIYWAFACGLIIPRHVLGGDQEHQAVLKHLRQKGVEVRCAIPLKQLWLEPKNGKSSPEKPLRVWFQGRWKPCIEDIECLPKLRELYGVTFDAQGIDERWLHVLTKLPHLQEVVLNGPNFTDEGAGYLAKIKNLNSLSLTFTQITDKGMGNLSQLKNLEFLSLAGSEYITDAGFRCVHLTNLRLLNLEWTGVKDTGIGSLTAAKKLEWLTLGGSQLSVATGDLGPFNAGLRHVVGLKNLKRLRIGEMEATEAEMKDVLRYAKNLPMIETSSGNYTRKGWVDNEPLSEKLRRAKRLYEKSKQ